jgi:hypothetical protein
MRHGTRRSLPTASVRSAVAILALLLLSAPTLAETRLCTTTELDEPFVLPSGLEHAPGRLTLCRSLEYSPSRTIYVGYVDRAPVEMLVSQRGFGEAPADPVPYMMFARDREGRLHLYGLSIPSHQGVETFLFDAFPFAGPRVSTTARYLGARP